VDAQTVLAWVGLLVVVVVPAIGWALAILRILRDVKRSTDELLRMHQDPNGAGFGTIALSQMVESNRRQATAVIHYLKWAAKHLTGIEPPPPLETEDPP
jgi:hypothetical protein